MNAPRRLLEEAKTPSERVIAAAASVAPQPMRADGWEDVMAVAVTSRQSVTRLLPAFLLSVVLGIALVMLSRPAPVAPPGAIAHATLGPVGPPSRRMRWCCSRGAYRSRRRQAHPSACEPRTRCWT